MPSSQDRESLLQRPYRELQRLAKKAGIKANLSRIILVEKLLAGSSDAADVNTPADIPSASDPPNPPSSEEIPLERPATPSPSTDLPQPPSREPPSHEDTQESRPSRPHLTIVIPQTLFNVPPFGHELPPVPDKDALLDDLFSCEMRTAPVQPSTSDDHPTDCSSHRISPPGPVDPPAQPSLKPVVLNSSLPGSPGIPLDLPCSPSPRADPAPSSNSEDKNPAAPPPRQLERLPSYQSDTSDGFGGLQYPASPPGQPSTFARYFSPAPSSGPIRLSPEDYVARVLPSPPAQRLFFRSPQPPRETTPLFFPASSGSPELSEHAKPSLSSLPEEGHTRAQAPVEVQDDYAENEQVAPGSDIDGGSDKENQAIIPPLTSADLMECRDYILDYSSGSEDPYAAEPTDTTPASEETLEKAVETMKYLHLRYLYYTHHARKRRRQAKTIIKETMVARRLLHQERASIDRMRTYAVYYRPAPRHFSTEDVWGWPMRLRKNEKGEWEELSSEDEDESDNEDREQEQEPETRRDADGARTRKQHSSRTEAHFAPDRAATVVSDNEASTSTPVAPRPMGRTPMPSYKEAPTRASKRKADTLPEPDSPEAEYPNKRLRLGNHFLSEAPPIAEQYGPEIVNEPLDEDPEDLEDAIDETTIEMLLNPEPVEDEGLDGRDDSGPILPAIEEQLVDIPLFGPGAHRRRELSKLDLFL